MSAVETRLTDAIAGMAPWLAPIPTAYLVGRAAVEALAWPLPVAVVAALVVESLGLAATNTALTLWEYNHARRKTDPTAPFPLAATLVGVYVCVAVGLTLALDVAPFLARYAPAIWPALSLTGVTVLAIRSDHARRLEAVKADRQEKRDARRQKTSNSVQTGQVDNLTPRPAPRQKNPARLAALLDMYREDPDLSPTEAARRMKVSRQTVYTYLTELEAAGKIHRNGRTEVL